MKAEQVTAETPNFKNRWRYLPRLWKLQWSTTGPKSLLLIAFFTFATSLLTVFNLEILRRLVDSGLGLIKGQVSVAYLALNLGILIYLEFASYVIGQTFGVFLKNTL